MAAFFMAYLRLQIVLLIALALIQIQIKIAKGTIFGVICINYLQIYV
ncbi:Uncharacterised protein [Chryseobacterium carnipullorum]|uniref:Uncharacterized protein n=1 Tax=Chryseobacterium carnipullorum TaxID=1124835 RepID=A0A376E5F2_CHRCU|nr:Uncharacterised protein [Chryseobacterium carnipullorum]